MVVFPLFAVARQQSPVVKFIAVDSSPIQYIYRLSATRYPTVFKSAEFVKLL